MVSAGGACVSGGNGCLGVSRPSGNVGGVVVGGCCPSCWARAVVARNNTALSSKCFMETPFGQVSSVIRCAKLRRWFRVKILFDFKWLPQDLRFSPGKLENPTCRPCYRIDMRKEELHDQNIVAHSELAGFGCVALG